MLNALDSRQIAVFALSGLGGIGKTAVARAFVEELSARSGSTIERVFAWSFEAELAGAAGVDSLGAFWDAALRFWGAPDSSAMDASEKARRLAGLMNTCSSVLILDNFEVLQRTDGTLRDRSVAVLLDNLRHTGDNSSRLVVITSRCGLSVLADTGSDHTMVLVQGGALELSPAAGAQLLRDQGVIGDEAQLQAMSEQLDGHPLTLALIGAALGRSFGGDVARLGELLADLRGNDRVTAILDYYLDKWTDGSPETQLLYVLAAFGIPVHRDELLTVVKAANPTGAVATMSLPEVTGVLSDLTAIGLVVQGASTYDLHSLAAGYLASRFAAHDRHAFLRTHEVLRDMAVERAAPTIRTVEDLQPLYRAVSHACLAGDYGPAFDDLYVKRISDGGRFLNASILGDRTGDLRVISCFFPEGLGSAHNAALETEKRWWLVARAAFDLSSLGRFEESIGPRCVGIELVKDLAAWGNAADDSRRLAHTLVNLGRLNEASRVIADANVFAERYRSAPELAVPISFLPKKDPCKIQQRCIADRAYISTLMGEPDDLRNAWAQFGEAEEKAVYHRLLLGLASNEAELERVRVLAESSLVAARESGTATSVANCEIVLAQALRRLNELAASEHLVDDARRRMEDAGRVDGLMRALTEKAAVSEAMWQVNHNKDRLIEAMQVLEQLDHLARFSGAELLRADGEFIRVAVLADLGERRNARIRLDALRRSTKSMGYQLREPDLERLGREVEA